MLGIVIGIASVIAMVAIGAGNAGNGAGEHPIARRESPDGDAAVASGRSGRRFARVTGARNPDAGRRDGARRLAGRRGGRPGNQPGGIRWSIREQNTNTTVMGTVPAYLQVRNVQVDQGSFITDADVTNANRIAVIGPTVLTDTFSRRRRTRAPTPDMAIGQVIRIKGNDFTVVGVTVAKGGSGFASQDNNIYVPVHGVTALSSWET